MRGYTCAFYHMAQICQFFSTSPFNIDVKTNLEVFFHQPTTISYSYASSITVQSHCPLAMP